ncbi:MAG: hypothetical protein JXB49_35980 [Bacteroidales bacterium]|nr:hypothetical protein [Bacteroidales bacterium]
MPDLLFEGNFANSNARVEVGLSIIAFTEDNNYIVYSPALDISGYGNNEAEAKRSFEITLEEFFKYTINKGTFESELKRLGWKLSGKKNNRKYKQPFLDQLFRDNHYLSEIIRDKEFKKYDQKIKFPAVA